MARDWHAYWNEAPQVHDGDALRQVGKTVGGTPVSPHLVALIVASITAALRVRPQDSVLDLCCGNGLISVEIAKRCARVTAIDFSGPLIETARQRFSGNNLRYMVADVTALPDTVLLPRFDKIYMQEALQHFSREQADGLLARLAASASRHAPLFLGSIPDAARLRMFYDTPERYRGHCENVTNDRDPIGTWWRQSDLVALAERHGYRATVIPQDSALHTAHYRFGLLCEPTGSP